MPLTKNLLSPLVNPHLVLRNRVVMAPMNRRRANQSIPAASAPLYYGQRADAGLIITENTAIAPNAIGALDTPGIYNDAQKTAWKRVVDEVHARDGKIFIQLVHAGRIGHPLNHEGGGALVAPSAIRAKELILTPGGQHLPMPEPEALSTAGVKAIIEAHVQAAVGAMEIGFDGVEIHGAHGYLPDQFLNPRTNHRTDSYGGSIANRSRFLLEIMEGVTAAIGQKYTGVRLSPFADINDLTTYDEERATHQYIIDALQQLGILYLHLSDLSSTGVSSIPAAFIGDVRKHFHGLLIVAGGYTADSGEAMLREGLADLIAFGRPFIANPDLVQRLRHGVRLAVPDEKTFYHGGDKGYIDYPAIYPETQNLCNV
jgi:N-ethylmaleimide reductase